MDRSSKTNVELLFLVCILVAATLGCSLLPEGTLKVPPEDELQKLVRTSAFDFGDAVQSGDVVKFHDTLSKFWQNDTSVEKLRGDLDRYIQKKAEFDLRTIIGSRTARLDPKPVIEKVGERETLKVNGTFRTQRDPLNVSFYYVRENREWKLSSLKVFYSNY